VTYYFEVYYVTLAHCCVNPRKFRILSRKLEAHVKKLPLLCCDSHNHRDRVKVSTPAMLPVFIPQGAGVLASAMSQAHHGCSAR
jgi:hypothetical protein